MAMPQTSDAPGEVNMETLGIIARVQANESIASLVKTPIERREALKAAMRALVDGDDNRIIAAGALNTAEADTDEALKAFSKKVAGEYADAQPSGEKHPEHKRLFDGKTAASLLPGARADRAVAIAALLERIAEGKTSAVVKKGAAAFQKAAAKEKAAAAGLIKAETAHAKLGEKVEATKVATVISVRELAGELQKKFAEEPAKVKRLLGQGKGGGKRKSTKAPKKPDEPSDE